MGVREVYLQRLTYDEVGYGRARFKSSLFERLRADKSAQSRMLSRWHATSALRSMHPARPSPVLA